MTKALSRALRGVGASVALAAVFAAPAWRRDSGEGEKTLRSIADHALKGASFQFEDRRDGGRYVDPELAPPGALVRPASRSNDWRYWNGVLNIGMSRLGERLKEPRYTGFPLKNIAFAFDHYRYFEEKRLNEGKWDYPFAQLFMMEELDDCGAMGAATIEVYSVDPQERYREYIDRAARHIEENQGRLEDGTLARRFPRLWTVWADDLYMGIAFLARMGELTGEPRYHDDAARQVIRYHRYLFDEDMGLMYHCWYSDTRTPGVAFWGRANGWALLAQVDLLDRLPADHSLRDTLLSLFRRHIRGILPYQSDEGLWRQLLDRKDSFLETSCSAMFTYALARGVTRGYLARQFADPARRGWHGVQSKVRPDGQIEGICAGTGVGEDLAHYYNRPTPLDDPHGTGAVLLAGAEVLLLYK